MLFPGGVSCGGRASGSGYDYDMLVVGGGSGGLACSKEGTLMVWVRFPAGHVKVSIFLRVVCA